MRKYINLLIVLYVLLSYFCASLGVASSLTDASYNGDLAKVKQLVNSGADVNGTIENNVTALHLAAQQGHKDIVEYLISQNAKVDAKAAFDTTPLHLAATNGHYEVCKTLISKGADINAKGKNKTTPLHQAASEGHLAVVQLLVENGAKTNERQSDPPNDLPIALATGQGHEKVVEYLLDHGDNVNSANMNGVTLLQVASYRGHKKIVQLLLARGADINTKNSKGMTALSLAEQQGNNDVIELLKEQLQSKSAVNLVVAGSLTVEPNILEITFDQTYGKTFGVLVVSEANSTNKFTSAYVSQIPSKRGQILKSFAGLPFLIQSLETNLQVELLYPIKIYIAGGNEALVWKEKVSTRKHMANHITGDKGAPQLNGMFFLAGSTLVKNWGIERLSRGRDTSIFERQLKEPRQIMQCEKTKMIVPTESSEIPWICDRQGFPKEPVPNAIGIVWIFEKAGIKIAIGNDCLLAERDGATIEFTGQGPVLKGIKRYKAGENENGQMTSGQKQVQGKKEKPYIFSFWQQTEDSERGFLGFEPKTDEVIIISKDNRIDGYAAGLGIHMMTSDCSISTDTITVKDYNLTLSYRISADILTMKTPEGKIMKYQRLTGTDRQNFIDRLFNEPKYSVDD